jgi:hypothetical protein
MKLKTFNKLISRPLIASMTGFGMFWWYQLSNWNIWLSIIIALYSTSLTTLILFKEGKND